MADATMQNRRDSARIPGWVLIASAIAMVVLLALHPEGSAKDFAGVLQQEAASRGTDAVVHGGFMVVLAIQIACYAIFSLRLSRAIKASITGLVMFCFGVVLLSGSLLIDGLVLPAIAAKYAGVPAKIESARVLYAFGGTLISILMPLGIAFQSVGIAAWSTGLLRTGRRVTGLAGLVIGPSMLAATIAATFTRNPIALMGAIAGLALWAVIAGRAMLGSGTK